jgi:hypothetical protein
MKKTLLRFSLSAVLLVAIAATPALAWGPGDPPPPGSAISTWVLIVSSLIRI